MRTLRWCFAATLVLACAEPSGPAIGIDTLDVHFDASRRTPCNEELWQTYSRGVTGKAGAIEATDIFGAANSGYELDLKLNSPSAGELVVTVTGTDHGGLGLDIVTCHPYSITLARVPAGRYKVHLVHMEQGRARADTVQRVSVVVE